MNAIATMTEHPCVRLVRAVALRRALWLRSEWACRPVAESMHQAIEELGEDPMSRRKKEMAFYASDPPALDLAETISAEAEALNQDEPWSQLTAQLGLSEPEVQLLALCIAAESDPSLRRLYGYLLDEASPLHASPWLAELLFAWPPGTAIHSASRLYRWRLATPMEGQNSPWSKTTSWIVDPAVVAFLNGEIALTAALKLGTEREAEWPGLFGSATRSTADFLREMKAQPATAYEIEVVGSPGSGRRTWAAQLAAEMGRPPLLIDIATLGLGPEPTEESVGIVARAARTAHFARAVPVWTGVETLPAWAWEAMATPHPIRVLVGERPAPAPASGVVRHQVKTSTLDYDQRVSLWEKLTGTPAPAPVQEWALTVGDLVAAAQIAPLGDTQIAALCRSRMGHDEDDLLSTLPCPFTWDDLVVQSHVEQHLHEFESQVRLRHAVFDDWGFGKHLPLGKGISALFAGPSGVGKTMAAQVLANSLGLELLRVDFASVINKYVGETEKRIRQVFRRCQRANVMLFIDECDAVFSHRVQTRDAQDRFANIEVDYLLQCMEQFDGVAVLATNRKGEIDNAFLRRIRFIVDFMPPAQTERLRLWKLALPEQTPSGESLLEGIDHGALAQKLNLTGAEIKNVAIGAAFLARAEGTKILMRQVVAAARREVAKHGTIVRPGEWEGL